MDLLYAMGGNKSGRSILKSVNLSTFTHEAVKYLLAKFNSNRVFELPPLAIVKEDGLSRLNGMDYKWDGHVWTETATTNISNLSGILSFKYVKCLGHLQCKNPSCRFVTENGSAFKWCGSCKANAAWRDLALQFVMFDHVKRIDKWTTLGAHVYDPVHCKVMTICVCDMKSEMAEHQKQMWRSLLLVMEQHGCRNVEFAAFMADNVQANFDAEWKIFGSSNKLIPMNGKECTCQFHWSTVLERHTRQHI